MYKFELSLQKNLKNRHAYLSFIDLNDLFNIIPFTFCTLAQFDLKIRF